MSEVDSYLKLLFSERRIEIAAARNTLFEAFGSHEANKQAVRLILENQKILMTNWKLINRVKDIIDQPVSIPNATVGKPYEAVFDFQKLNWTDVTFTEFAGLTEIGLAYDADNKTISGTPLKSGDLKAVLKFRVDMEEDGSELNEKQISLVVNPDPKSLWKNIDSDRNDKHWKEDNIAIGASLGTKQLIAASRRGRSHANTGTFRDDDFAFKYFDETGWALVVVADGAGSAKLSRAGSAIACNEVVEYFSTHLQNESFDEFDKLVNEFQQGTGEDTLKKLNQFVYHNLGEAALFVHKKLEEAAIQLEAALKDLHTTLIFALYKKYDFGYAVLSFGVGDCPIGLVSKDISEVTLMNWLDVGEYGGGTRFVTMPEIFKSDNFHTRFGFKIIDDFSYLILMTDGIYDPKFVVEANLEKLECWKAFLEDLQGKNAEGIQINFEDPDVSLPGKLAAWMDFWSPGNHDDRTLAIVF